ncbi:glycoside hydrolase family 3 N-terminal domain-containing protein [Amycolatopsis aidingensis]|uniref:glycoside hydrolase family 3 N-terminal domain-containing protein n=1 Tax=Amycolatopsis aidingensis TaxID=2842453 RepID=UPI001C0D3BE5|nr:glycoside hydrolase family 3 N-terminal domain-containing protein [Amycolatopsis aidingensis]
MLSSRQKLAQRLIALPGVTGDGRPDEETRAALGAGLGVLHGLAGTSVSGAARYHIEVAELGAGRGLPPPLVAANLESGVGYSLGGGGTDFPYPRGVGHGDDAGLARLVAEEAGREARLVGFHWTFSPCVDVLTEPNDPILGVRAFGLDAERTGALGAAQVRGYQDGDLLATAKHFPGHGDSPTDTHAAPATLPRTRGEHELVHLSPFRAAVAAGVASVMVAHVALPRLGVDGPASLSPVVNRTWLRTELAYQGIIVTDSLRMGAIAASMGTAEAAVAALMAGADVANVKCQAGEIPPILDTLEEALAAGALDPGELDDAVARLLRARAGLGLHREHGVDLERCGELDAGGSWGGADLARTVSTDGRPDVPGPAVVVGDSQLARLVAQALASARGEVRHEAIAVDVEALASVARAHPEATVVAVACPLPAEAGRDSAAFAFAVRSVRADGYPVVAVVNSAAPAEELGVDAPTVSAPAVDAFGVVSGAAVAAVVEALR